jgi:hypothetical protein
VPQFPNLSSKKVGPNLIVVMNGARTLYGFPLPSGSKKSLPHGLLTSFPPLCTPAQDRGTSLCSCVQPQSEPGHYQHPAKMSLPPGGPPCGYCFHPHAVLASYVQSTGVSPRGDFAPRGHLAISGNTCGHHNWELLVWSGWRLHCPAPCRAQDTPQRMT